MFMSSLSNYNTKSQMALDIYHFLEQLKDKKEYYF